MITRITRGTLRPNTEARVFEILRRAAARHASPPGMLSVSISRRVTDRTVEFVAITIWSDLEQMAAIMGPSWRDVAWLPGLSECVVESSVEILETVVSSVDDLVRLEPAV